MAKKLRLMMINSVMIIATIRFATYWSK